MFADLADLGPARLGRLVFATFLPHLQFPTGEFRSSLVQLFMCSQHFGAISNKPPRTCFTGRHPTEKLSR